jgi:hypothetical protein
VEKQLLGILILSVSDRNKRQEVGLSCLYSFMNRTSFGIILAKIETKPYFLLSAKSFPPMDFQLKAKQPD